MHVHVGVFLLVITRPCWQTAACYAEKERELQSIRVNSSAESMRLVNSYLYRVQPLHALQVGLGHFPPRLMKRMLSK